MYGFVAAAMREIKMNVKTSSVTMQRPQGVCIVWMQGRHHEFESGGGVKTLEGGGSIQYKH